LHVDDRLGQPTGLAVTAFEQDLNGVDLTRSPANDLPCMVIRRVIFDPAFQKLITKYAAVAC